MRVALRKMSFKCGIASVSKRSAVGAAELSDATVATVRERLSVIQLSAVLGPAIYDPRCGSPEPLFPDCKDFSTSLYPLETKRDTHPVPWQRVPGGRKWECLS